MVIDMVMNKRPFFVNERPFKRTKRVSAAYNNNHCYDFLTFPAPTDFTSGEPFQSAIQSFLSTHARSDSPDESRMTWQIQFRVGAEDPIETLYIIEEDVLESSRSRSVHCEHCRVVGWSRHPVCNKKYHFIIKRSSSVIQQLVDRDQKDSSTCKSCNNVFHQSSFRLGRCKSCNNESGVCETENWLNNQLENNTHVLHGVIHSNGYGHLLTLNGRAGGSEALSGCDIMNFWDRLCRTLSVRKITIMDVSKKYGMDYRLVHSIANGRPWYGNWGYEFGSASYALTLEEYKESISTLSNLPLSVFSYNPRRPRTRLQNLIALYQEISESKLRTVRDLFSLMFKLICKINKSSIHENRKVCDSSVSCIWSMEEIGVVEQAVISLLQLSSNWVPKRVLKGALSKKAPEDLIEFCLQNLRGRKAADDNGMVVSTRCNHDTMAIQFRLEHSVSMSGENRITLNSNQSKDDIIYDLKFLYDSILNPQTMINYKPEARREIAIASATKILDCKQLVKDYKPENLDDTKRSTIRILCHLEVDDHKDEPPPPPELLVLPENTTVGDLKLKATEAFKESYVIFKGLKVEKMMEFGVLDDKMTVKLLVGWKGSVRVKGQSVGRDDLSEFKMERGLDNWVVDCVCGAKDDDGERMLACDECDTWQHTRCAGIGNLQQVPKEFVCDSCLEDLVDEGFEGGEECEEKSIFSGNGKRMSKVGGGKRCRDLVYSNIRKPHPHPHPRGACFSTTVQ